MSLPSTTVRLSLAALRIPTRLVPGGGQLFDRVDEALAVLQESLSL